MNHLASNVSHLLVFCVCLIGHVSFTSINVFDYLYKYEEVFRCRQTSIMEALSSSVSSSDNTHSSYSHVYHNKYSFAVIMYYVIHNKVAAFM